MKKYIKILLIIGSLVLLACLISSCDIIPQEIFGRKIPEHNSDGDVYDNKIVAQ